MTIEESVDVAADEEESTEVTAGVDEATFSVEVAIGSTVTDVDVDEKTVLVPRSTIGVVAATGEVDVAAGSTTGTDSVLVAEIPLASGAAVPFDWLAVPPASTGMVSGA